MPAAAGRRRSPDRRRGPRLPARARSVCARRPMAAAPGASPPLRSVVVAVSRKPAACRLVVQRDELGTASGNPRPNRRLPFHGVFNSLCAAVNISRFAR
eukprot:5417623-Prymnesium_polylepis.1